MKKLILFLATTCWFAASGAGFQPTTLPLGSAAPEFNLPGVDGRSYTLQDFAKAHALVIVFTCNHCPTAQYYEERLKKIANDYSPKGVALVAVSPNDPLSVRLDELGWSDLGDSFEEMKLRARERQFNFPYLFEGDGSGVARAYGPVATPHAFLFDSDRKLRYVGAIDDSERPAKITKHYLRDAIDALLAGNEPPVTKTKVIGCSVKWAGKADSVKAYMEKLALEPVSISPADTNTLKQLLQPNDKFRLINFWATWCAPCIVEFPEFITMNRMYRHRDFELVTVSINRPDEEKSVLDFLKKQQASCRNLLFASTDRSQLMEAVDPKWEGEVPLTLFIAPGGQVLYRQTGSIDPLTLKRLIVKSMNERKPW